jgi:hypothetical protein
MLPTFMACSAQRRLQLPLKFQCRCRIARNGTWGLRPSRSRRTHRTAPCFSAGASYNRPFCGHSFRAPRSENAGSTPPVRRASDSQLKPYFGREKSWDGSVFTAGQSALMGDPMRSQFMRSTTRCNAGLAAGGQLALLLLPHRSTFGPSKAGRCAHLRRVWPGCPLWRAFDHPRRSILAWVFGRTVGRAPARGEPECVSTL